MVDPPETNSGDNGAGMGNPDDLVGPLRRLTMAPANTSRTHGAGAASGAQGDNSLGQDIPLLNLDPSISQQNEQNHAQAAGASGNKPIPKTPAWGSISTPLMSQGSYHGFPYGQPKTPCTPLQQSPIRSPMGNRTSNPRVVGYRHSLLPGDASHHPPAHLRYEARHSAVVNNIPPPILNSSDPYKVIKFLQDREEYEEKIHALQISSGIEIQVSPWRYSVKRKILTTLYTLGKFETVAPGVPYKELNSGHVQAVILKIAERSHTNNYGAANIGDIAKKLRMDMRIRDPEARIEMLVADFTEALTNAGIPDYLAYEPRSAIRVLTDALHPPLLKAKIEEDLRRCYKLKTQFIQFIGHVNLIAKQLDVAEDAKRALKIKNAKDGYNPRKETDTRHRKGSDDPPSTEPRKPMCLYPSCAKKGIRHWLNDCTECFRRTSQMDESIYHYGLVVLRPRLTF